MELLFMLVGLVVLGIKALAFGFGATVGVGLALKLFFPK